MLESLLGRGVAAAQFGVDVGPAQLELPPLGAREVEKAPLPLSE